MDFTLAFDKFLTARQLFCLLVSRFETEGLEVRKSVLQFLPRWLTKRQDLFHKDPTLLAELINWVRSFDETSLPPTSVIRTKLCVKSLFEEDHSARYKEIIEAQLAGEDQSVDCAPHPYGLLCATNTLYDFLDIHPIEMARQMTIIDSEMFRKIQIQEWLSKGWTKGTSENIIRFINRFNHFSNFVSFMVCIPSSIEVRTIVIEYFLCVAMAALELNNFNAIMEIVSGLTSAPVARLLQTWDVLDREGFKRFEDIKDLVSFSNNFRHLRQIMASVLGECIPYIAVFLSDLIYIEDGNSDYTENGMINFEKHEMLAQHVQEVEKYGMHRYKLIPVAEIVDYLRDLPVIGEDEIYQESLARECREENSKLKEKWERKGLFL
eukprot:TRINITY_DN5157_c0_g1_i2.p1 TRINITY_DN5157_c0_g1~~TRINITY_DN5157_c0_g1_i2.p1  ORF type:complete len:379 (-),score=58.26 TRINITY_DN5157_c0_g1_i2:119-1255(-)